MDFNLYQYLTRYFTIREYKKILRNKDNYNPNEELLPDNEYSQELLWEYLKTKKSKRGTNCKHCGLNEISHYYPSVKTDKTRTPCGDDYEPIRKISKKDALTLIYKYKIPITDKILRNYAGEKTIRSFASGNLITPTLTPPKQKKEIKC